MVEGQADEGKGITGSTHFIYIEEERIGRGVISRMHGIPRFLPYYIRT